MLSSTGVVTVVHFDRRQSTMVLIGADDALGALCRDGIIIIQICMGNQDTHFDYLFMSARLIGLAQYPIVWRSNQYTLHNIEWEANKAKYMLRDIGDGVYRSGSFVGREFTVDGDDAHEGRPVSDAESIICRWERFEIQIEIVVSSPTGLREIPTDATVSPWSLYRDGHG